MEWNVLTQRYLYLKEQIIIYTYIILTIFQVFLFLFTKHIQSCIKNKEKSNYKVSKLVLIFLLINEKQLKWICKIDFNFQLSNYLYRCL